jgi:dolichyl-phosphate-mannose--protein O-mannosyl transferase
VLVLAAALRLYNLDSPPEHMFDEVYYAKDARALIDGRMEGKPHFSWQPGDVVSWPHPDAGKMAIALGILAVGDRPVGWRLPSVVAGLVLLASVYPIARRLGLDQGWAFVALLFASADLLGIAQSRIATLDVFVALWTALCVLFALRYVQDGRRLRWLALAGLAGGLAASTKWSGALALVAAVVIVVLGRQLRALAGRERSPGQALAAAGREGAAVQDGAPVAAGDEVAGDTAAVSAGDAAVAPAGDTAAASTGDAAASPAGDSAAASTARPIAPQGRRPRDRRPLAAELGLLALCLVVLPAVIYLASYAAYFANGHSVADFRELHSQMLHFNFNLSATHSYSSSAPTWILDYRPVWYSFREIGGRFHGVVAMGNPLLWWGSILALAAAPLLSLRRREAAPVLAALLVVVLYLPWFATSRTSFLYYMTPVAPFLAILSAAVAASLVDGRRRGGETDAGRQLAPALPWRIAVIVAAAAATALFWYPFGRAATVLFWELPARVSGGLSWALMIAGVVAAVAASLLALSSSRFRPWFVLTAIGVIVGIAVPFLPIALDVAVSKEAFYRLMWFPSWI